MLIKNMLEDVGDDTIRQDNPIPIPNVSPTSPSKGFLLESLLIAPLR